MWVEGEITQWGESGGNVYGKLRDSDADASVAFTVWRRTRSEIPEGISQGDRVGVGWIHSSDGTLNENLSPCFRATGRDVNGGYAEYMTVPAQYAYPIPSEFSDEAAAPLLAFFRECVKRSRPW